jgi:hypothetical protein
MISRVPRGVSPRPLMIIDDRFIRILQAMMFMNAKCFSHSSQSKNVLPFS